MTWGSLCIMLISIAFVTVRRDLIGLYIKTFGEWIDTSYNYLVHNSFLNYLLAISIGVFGIKTLLSIYRTKEFNLLVLLCCTTILTYVNCWPGEYLSIFSLFTYQWLLNSLLVLLIGIEICVLVSYIRRVIPETLDRGLLIRSPEYITDGKKVYAETIADLIINSPIRDRSFAVGIAGEWGAGKTLVLSEIDNLLKGKAIIVKFKPWNSKSPDLLIDDFFSELRKEIDGKNSNIGETISKYAAHIIELDVDKRLSSLVKFGSVASKEISTIASLKKKVEDLLIDLEKNVVVLIDDLDRLDSDELFETLRIIRNTADFRNVVYVVTYDQDYVSRMLEGKGIVNAERYLEKIFTTTVSLPTYEPSAKVWATIPKQQPKSTSPASTPPSSTAPTP